MSAEGYQSAPLSDAMERRIQERIRQVRELASTASVNILAVHDTLAALETLSALEWVLNEAEALKAEGPARFPEPSRFEKVCHVCGHEHLDEQKCNWPMGGPDRQCPCEQRRTA